MCKGEASSIWKIILYSFSIARTKMQWGAENSWASMILKLWVLRLYKTRIWLINSATRRSTNKHIPTTSTDNRAALPINSPIRIIVTAADVLHSWTVPRLGVKTDATPGRLNQVRFSINRPGLLYGQCSEICGANHRFMPIVIERVSTNQFINWVSKISESSDDWKQVMVS